MPVHEEVASFEGDWRPIGSSVYASYVLPAKMPTWIPLYMNGLSGLILGSLALRRYPAPPWAVIIYRTKRFRSFRVPVIYRQEFDALREANARAEDLDKDLSAGRLPAA